MTPQGPLERADFETIAKAVNPVIISKGKVRSDDPYEIIPRMAKLRGFAAQCIDCWPKAIRLKILRVAI